MNNIRKSARGIKVGDKVRVTRAAGTRELGWENSWIEPMDRNVGTIQTVEEVRGTNVYFEGAPVGYPWFVLEVVGYEHHN